MALAPGTRLGPYEIAAHLAEGGMGEVYRARDTRLDRIVALKISKEQFTPRFETEARATAALEHPHICRLYDICHEEGTSFLVMEYVEGTPLKGPLPLNQVLMFAGQMASALDAAHRKQIVHRDLKPSNVLVTPKGGVKLLDFGLAKLGYGTGALDDEALTRGLTAAGTIVGTLHYMSPEQLQGAAADARSDIFAFGVVLYEMLTGKHAFDGASPASVIAAILERPAPSIATVAPSSLDRLLQRCLAKDPDERWQSARDVKAALDLIVEPTIAAPAPPVHSSRRAPWPWIAAASLAAALGGLAFVRFREAPPRAELVTFQIAAPESKTITSEPFLSPDGRSVAFVAAGADGVRSIAVRTLAALVTRVLPGTENVIESLIWSPDGRSIAFVADRKLKAIDLAGGTIRIVSDDVDSGAIGGGFWNSDGTIVFSAFQKGLRQVPASGGKPAPFTTPAANEIHVLPSLLPDGRYIYVAIDIRDRKAELRVATFGATAVSHFALEEGGRLAYVPSARNDGRGNLLFTRGNALVAQPVNAATLSALGEPVVVADDVRADVSGAPAGAFSVTATGALAYLSGDVWKPSQLTWFNREGVALGVVGPTAKYNDLSLSRDETRLAVTVVTAAESVNGDIWLIDLTRNTRARFTSDAAQDWHPVWSPDGSRLAFSSTRLAGGRQNAIFWKNTANIGSEEVVSQGPANQRLNDWSPDGKLMLFENTTGRGDLWILPISPTTPKAELEPQPYLQSTQFSETRGQFYPVTDPTGRYWIAYSSNESGQSEIYVESFPRGAPRVTVSTAGGMEPRWRRDGRELFYLTLDKKLMAVDVSVGKQLEFGVPKTLFQSRLASGNTDVSRVLRYDATHDGKRFLINTQPEGADAGSAVVTVVLNWASALKE